MQIKIGSLFDQLFSIFNGEVKVIELLAGSLPGQGEFFIEFVLVKFAFLTLMNVHFLFFFFSFSFALTIEYKLKK